MVRKWNRWLALGLVVLLAGSCGDNPVSNTPPEHNGGGPQDLGPFTLSDIFLRPYSIQVPPPAGGTPTPTLVEHYLAGFYSGGTELASFDWTVPGFIGTVEPKTPNLSRSAATVVLKLRADGAPPLGLFAVQVRAHSGADSSSMERRFAVVQNTWIKHQRGGFTGDEPEDLVSYPTILTHAAGPATADTLFYVLSSGPTGIGIQRIAWTEDLSGGEQTALETFRVEQPEGSNYLVAPKTMPDVAPVGLGRKEMLFSSRMDPQFQDRCPIAVGCTFLPGFRLWVVNLPQGQDNLFLPHVLTGDSTYLQYGRPLWYAFNFEQARWDPRATGSRARIAFLSNLAGNGVRELWLADLVDRNGDNRSDTLEAYRDLTPGQAVGSYDWHPDGTRLCVAVGSGLAWVDAASGATSPIEIPDSTLAKIRNPAVFWRAGENTLIAFQAETENLRNLYLLDVEANSLTRLLPYAVPVTHNLFPRWHPTRKELIYVSDYTVMPWANSTPGYGTSPDRLNPGNPELYGMPRTLFPSLWSLKLE